MSLLCFLEWNALVDVVDVWTATVGITGRSNSHLVRQNSIWPSEEEKRCKASLQQVFYSNFSTLVQR